MQGSLEQPPIVIRSSAWKSFLLTAASAAACAFCVTVMSLFPLSGASRAPAGAVLFGLAALWFGWRLVRPDVLTLTPDGFAWQSRFRTTHWAWRDTEHFRAVSVHIASKRVGFDLAAGSDGPRSYTQYYVSYAGADAALGGGWELSPGALAELLNTARARWV